MPAIKNTKSVQEFLRHPSNSARKEAKPLKTVKTSPTILFYLRAPKGKNPKTGKPEPGSVEFRVMSPECVFGFSFWYDTEDGGRAISDGWLRI